MIIESTKVVESEFVSFLYIFASSSCTFSFSLWFLLVPPSNAFTSAECCNSSIPVVPILEFLHRFVFLLSFHDFFPFIPALPFRSLLLSLRSNSYSFRFTSFVAPLPFRSLLPYFLFVIPFLSFQVLFLSFQFLHRFVLLFVSFQFFHSVRYILLFISSLVPYVSTPSLIGFALRFLATLPFRSLFFSFRSNSCSFRSPSLVTLCLKP